VTFISAKNATKPNPFKIIPLQPKKREQLGDRRNDGESNSNSGDGPNGPTLDIYDDDEILFTLC
jgi:hypothetical protein